MRLIKVSGVFEVPEHITDLIFVDLLIEWVEAKGFHFGGSFADVTDEVDDQEYDDLK
jgi:hypothetical protein